MIIHPFQDKSESEFFSDTIVPVNRADNPFREFLSTFWVDRNGWSVALPSGAGIVLTRVQPEGRSCIILYRSLPVLFLRCRILITGRRPACQRRSDAEARNHGVEELAKAFVVCNAEHGDCCLR